MGEAPKDEYSHVSLTGSVNVCAHVCARGGKVVNGYYGRNRMETEGNLYWDWSFLSL